DPALQIARYVTRSAPARAVSPRSTVITTTTIIPPDTIMATIIVTIMAIRTSMAVGKINRIPMIIIIRPIRMPTIRWGRKVCSSGKCLVHRDGVEIGPR
ncbi:MAG TPA: hypothetical protein VMX97_00885, partial [Hyphomicrobiaceae bacterium]|nr:hypothetical protein [Hyphomicrobiaceae bacterium]